MSRIYGIGIDVDDIIINQDTMEKGYIGWWCCSDIDVKVTMPNVRKTYLEAISDAVINAQLFANNTGITFISEGGVV